MPSMTSSEPSVTKEKAVSSTASTSGSIVGEMHYRNDSSRPRWRWESQAQAWRVTFLGQCWSVDDGNSNWAYFLRDIQRIDVFPRLTRSIQ